MERSRYHSQILLVDVAIVVVVGPLLRRPVVAPQLLVVVQLQLDGYESVEPGIERGDKAHVLR